MFSVKKIICAVLLLMCACDSGAENRYVFNKELMYTVFDIVVYSKSSRNTVAKQIDEVWERLEYLNRELSPAGSGFVVLCIVG